MRHSSARATRRANSTAWRLTTGSVPGSPAQTGQTAVLGGALTESTTGQAQNILDLVSSSAWVSRPMTGSYSMWMYVPKSSCDPICVRKPSETFS